MMTREHFEKLVAHGGMRRVFVREEDVPLHEQLDALLGDDLRCPYGLSTQEWVGYLEERHRRDGLGLRAQDLVE